MPHEVNAALNQLTSIIAGRDYAVATNTLTDDAMKRIEAVKAMASKGMIQATEQGDMKGIKQEQRKLESLNSIETLAKAAL